MPANEKVSAGQRIATAATTHNDIIDTKDAYKSGLLGKPTQRTHTPHDYTACKVKNTAGVDLRKGEVLEITEDALLDDAYLEGNLWLTGYTPAGDGLPFGVLRRATVIDAIEPLQLVGVCMALVNVTSLEHHYAQLSGSLTVLQSSIMGPVRILKPPTSTGEQLVPVLLNGAPHRPWIRFSLDAAMATTDSNKAATIEQASWTETTPTETISVWNELTHTNGTYLFEGDLGDFGRAEWREVDGSWWIYQMECPE